MIRDMTIADPSPISGSLTKALETKYDAVRNTERGQAQRYKQEKFDRSRRL
jgi:hypothetical protein